MYIFTKTTSNLQIYMHIEIDENTFNIRWVREQFKQIGIHAFIISVIFPIQLQSNAKDHNLTHLTFLKQIPLNILARHTYILNFKYFLDSQVSLSLSSIDFQDVNKQTYITSLKIKSGAIHKRYCLLVLKRAHSKSWDWIHLRRLLLNFTA